MKKIRISGTGCALVDNLYSNIDFNSGVFKKYLSKTPGDGGLSPGKLVFAEEFENFSGKKIDEVLVEITSGKKPDAVSVGGPSIVSLIHLSQMLYDTDTEILFYGARGDDARGDTIFKNIECFKIDFTHYKKVTRNSPFTDVFSDPSFNQGHGERIFVNNIGAAWEFYPYDLDDDFFQSDIVVFGGTALVPNLHDQLTSVLKKAKSKDCFTIVNTVYDFRNEKKDPQKAWPLGESMETYKFIDLLIMDYEEALRLSGEKELTLAEHFFRDAGLHSFIITNGPESVHMYSDGTAFVREGFVKLPVSALVKQNVKEGKYKGDTTGCGDNFVGGVVYSVAMQVIDHTVRLPDLKEACRWGIASGGYTCSYIGGTYYEKQEGGKRLQVKHLYDEYKKQTLCTS